MNDEEFLKIKEISKNIDNEVLILFWQLTIRTLEELDIVSNQNLSIEMFLIKLMHLSEPKIQKELLDNNLSESLKKNNMKVNFQNETIDQIKNVTQEKKIKSETQVDVEARNKISIQSFNELLNCCSEKKEIKLKYELEKNVNLVSFEKNRIEISFNDNLDKNFIKDLSLKLFEWTDQRWVITLSKLKGEISIKEKEKLKKIELLEKAKKSELYKNILTKLPDASLIDVMSNEEIDE